MGPTLSYWVETEPFHPTEYNRDDLKIKIDRSRHHYYNTDKREDRYIYIVCVLHTHHRQILRRVNFHYHYHFHRILYLQREGRGCVVIDTYTPAHVQQCLVHMATHLGQIRSQLRGQQTAPSQTHCLLPV